MSRSEPRPVRIGSRTIGPGRPAFVIAEAGVNHGGDLDQARRLVTAAKLAGADCIKFQTFAAERVASAQAGKAPYQLQTTARDESQLDMLRALELDEPSHRELSEMCERDGIVFLSTPYSIEDVDILERLGVPAYKIASALIVEPDFVRYVADRGKPVILSTGLATLDEVEEAVAVVRSTGNEDLVVLQCTTNYPASAADANLMAMDTMRRQLDVLVGYSDHTVGLATSLAAVALGAVVVEKHLTLDRSLPGPDHASSATPEELTALVHAIREVEAALGDGSKQPSAAEQANSESMRRSLVARTTIPAGAAINSDMLIAKRPGTGIPPRDVDSLLARTAKVDIAADQPIEWWMID